MAAGCTGALFHCQAQNPSTQASTKAAELPRVDDTLVALGNAVAATNATDGER